MNFRLLPVLLFFYFAGFVFVLAEVKIIENSGFVPGNLWFSRIPAAVGEKVQIYTLVWNGSENDIAGTVSFFDNDTIISKQDFVLAGAGSTKILSAAWTAGDGYHKIYAQITDSEGAPRGSKAVSVSLQYSKTVESENFVSTPAPPATTTSAVASNFVNQKVDYATSYLETNLPKPVVGAVAYIADNFESARTDAEVWTGDEIKKLKSGLTGSASEDKKNSILSDKTAAETDGAGFNIDGPFKYAALAFLSAGNYIFGNAWLFYGLSLIAVFFVIRFIKRKFFF
ncbi:MAG: hypothetical protein WC835_01835 [Candidatus Paceibacterota bacterium]|jgi:hypothetical protein